MSSDSIAARIDACTTLLDALMAVRTLGLQSGFIQIVGGDTRGLVEFQQNKILNAVIAQTGLAGAEALNVLIPLRDATCRYLEPEHNLDEWRGPEKASDTLPTPRLKAPGWTPGRLPLRAAEKLSDRLDQLPNLHDSDSTFDDHTGVNPFEDLKRRHKEDFERVDGRLAEPEGPIRRDTHLALPKDFDGPPPDPDLIALAKIGFVTDFHNPGSALAKKLDLFHGDPANVKTAEFKRASKSSITLVKFVMPACVFALCVGIYVLPPLIWNRHGEGDGSGARQKQMVRIADSAYDSLDLDGIPSQHNFVPIAMVPGGTTPGGTQSAVAAGGKDKLSEKEMAAVDRSNFTERSLADTREGLVKLEMLIHQYISKANFRRARDLAGSGFRSKVATVPERQKFWDLYKECLEHLGHPS